MRHKKERKNAMEETFNITVEMLKVKGACASGMRDFLREFPREQYPDGADYQEVLNRCAEHERPNYAEWLINEFGATNTTLSVDEINTDGYVFFAGRIEARGKIRCKAIRAACSIKAGWGIEAGAGIQAGPAILPGWAITAGWRIKAGWGIKAGEDFGVYAGLSVRLSNKSQYAKITAKEKPANIICGEWVPFDD